MSDFFSVFWESESETAFSDEVVDAAANRFSAYHSVQEVNDVDPSRIRKLYHRLNEARWYEPNFPKESALDEALSDGGFREEILERFERSDLKTLKSRIADSRTLARLPIYSLSESGLLLESAILSLKENRDHLLHCGIAPLDSYSSSESGWLKTYIQNLYFVKVPVGQCEGQFIWAYTDIPDRAASWDPLCFFPELGMRIYSSRFPTADSDGQVLNIRGEAAEICSYEKSNLMEGLSEEEAGVLVGLRERVFKIKATVLEELHRAVRSDDGVGLAERCWKVIEDQMEPSQITTLIERDKWYNRYPFNSGRMPYRDETGRTTLNPGGISDLLHIVKHYDSELTLQTLGQVYSILRPILERDHYNFPLRDAIPYCWMSDEDTKTVDEAIDRYNSMAGQEAMYESNYERRLSQWLLDLKGPGNREVSLPTTQSGFQESGEEIKYEIRKVTDRLLHITFAGRVYEVNNRKGWTYITYLLLHPNQPNITLDDLLRLTGDAPPTDSGEDTIIDPRLRPDVRDGYLRRINEKKAELKREQKEPYSDNEKIEQLEGDIEIYKASLSKDRLARMGLSTQEEKHRKRIERNVSRAIDDLKKDPKHQDVSEDTDLWRHLKDHIKIRRHSYYMISDPPLWR